MIFISEPLKCDSRGTYRLGIEDIPRNKDHPNQMDPSVPRDNWPTGNSSQNITTKATARTTTASKLIDMNQTSHLEKGHTSADDTSQRHRKSSAGQPSGEGVHLAQFLGE